MKHTVPLGLYAVATEALGPFAPLLLRARAAMGKEDPRRLNERLGRPQKPRPNAPLVWLHGVSVGESLSLLPLVDAIRAYRSHLTILVTSGTVTSAQLLAKRLPEGVIHQFAPIDTPGAAARFLDHWRPGIAIFVESEIWPNLISHAERRGVRLALVSARMTQASAEGWARAPATALSLLGAFDLILPQDADTRARLERLGAEVGPSLNLKLAGPPPPVDASMVLALREAIAGRKVVLAASTHAGEEPLIAGAVPAGALLVVAPRHPERGPQVAADLAALGFSVARRAAGEPLTTATTAYVADTLGELGALFIVADVVVMGGSFVDGIGGHNPLEPARLGRAIVTGPHAFNARDVYAEMFAEVAAIEAADPQALARHLGGLTDNPMIARRIGEAALAYANRQGAALDAAIALIAPLLPA